MTMLMMISDDDGDHDDDNDGDDDADDGEDINGYDEEDDLSLQASVGEVEVYREKGVGHHICYKNWNTNLKFSNRSN